jgi:DNA (cytosine-5)-methyltransferase 1
MNFGELIIDSFAGGGGASTGIEAAMGRSVDIAINHDQGAISMHMVNHPQTRHYCESVWDVDPLQACGGCPIRLAWFSPDCKHFSKAKGGKPVEKNIRGLAWIVLRWAALPQDVRPRVIMLENVEEFKTWGPLKDGRPCPRRKGETFELWKSQLEALGYVIDHRELRACDYGAPTIRKRLFVVARCDGQPIVWPAPTHGPGTGRKHRAAAECIDWSIPCPSIFERKRPLAENTLRRIARGIQRFVIESKDPFIVPGTAAPFITEHANASSQRNMSASEPLRTQCAQVNGGHFALVTAFLAQHNLGATGHRADSPLSTLTGRGTQQNIVVANLVRHFGQSVGSQVDEPVGTIVSGGLGKTGLVTSHLVKLRGTCQHGQPVTDPAPTITAGGTHVGEVRAFLLKYYGTNIGLGCNDPLHTVPTRDRFGLVTVRGQDYQIVDIGMRMLSPRELYLAQGFPADYVIDHDFHGTPITKTEQVKRCGNSVCPPIAEALVRANVVEQQQQEVA